MSLSLILTGTDTLAQAHAQLTAYRTRYSTRLHAKNVAYIERLLFLIQNVLKYLAVDVARGQRVGKDVVELNEFLFAAKIDHLNPFKLAAYLERSLLIRKVAVVDYMSLWLMHGGKRLHGGHGGGSEDAPLLHGQGRPRASRHGSAHRLDVIYTSLDLIHF